MVEVCKLTLMYVGGKKTTVTKAIVSIDELSYFTAVATSMLYRLSTCAIIVLSWNDVSSYPKSQHRTNEAYCLHLSLNTFLKACDLMKLASCKVKIVVESIL